MSPEQSFAFVYAKDKIIKVLTPNDSKQNHETLISEGWKHTNTLDPCVFIQYLYNECEDCDRINEIEFLLSTPTI